jgi:ABC-type glycerol-3-phosphate transport system permease component
MSLSTAGIREQNSHGQLFRCFIASAVISVIAVVAAVIVSALVGRFLFRLMFDDSDDF